eukprot:gene2059-1245_t
MHFYMRTVVASAFWSVCACGSVVVQLEQQQLSSSAAMPLQMHCSEGRRWARDGGDFSVRTVSFMRTYLWEDDLHLLRFSSSQLFDQMIVARSLFLLLLFYSFWSLKCEIHEIFKFSSSCIFEFLFSVTDTNPYEGYRPVFLHLYYHTFYAVSSYTSSLSNTSYFSFFFLFLLSFAAALILQSCRLTSLSLSLYREQARIFIYLFIIIAYYYSSISKGFFLSAELNSPRSTKIRRRRRPVPHQWSIVKQLLAAPPVTSASSGGCVLSLLRHSFLSFFILFYFNFCWTYISHFSSVKRTTSQLSNYLFLYGSALNNAFLFPFSFFRLFAPSASPAAVVCALTAFYLSCAANSSSEKTKKREIPFYVFFFFYLISSFIIRLDISASFFCSCGPAARTTHSMETSSTRPTEVGSEVPSSPKPSAEDLTSSTTWIIVSVMAVLFCFGVATLIFCLHQHCRKKKPSSPAAPSIQIAVRVGRRYTVNNRALRHAGQPVVGVELELDASPVDGSVQEPDEDMDPRLAGGAYYISWATNPYRSRGSPLSLEEAADDALPETPQYVPVHRSADTPVFRSPVGQSPMDAAGSPFSGSPQHSTTALPPQLANAEPTSVVELVATPESNYPY